MFEEFKDDARKSWKWINSVFGSDRKINSIPSVRDVDQMIDSDLNIASAFENYFISIGKNVANNLQPIPTNTLFHLNGNFVNSCFMFETSADEGIGIINGVKNKKFKSVEKLPISVLKCVASTISSQLSSAMIVSNNLIESLIIMI